MNGKLVMEITIQQLQHPLLYERLRGCVSARERAAVLRALAEAQLRGDSNGTRSTHGAPSGSRATATTDAFAPPVAATVAKATTTTAPVVDADSGFSSVRVDDSDASGSVFGSYLESASFF